LGEKTAIVILNYKNWQDTNDCLDAVLNVTYQPLRVIVVDNDSKMIHWLTLEIG